MSNCVHSKIEIKNVRDTDDNKNTDKTSNDYINDVILMDNIENYIIKTDHYNNDFRNRRKNGFSWTFNLIRHLPSKQWIAKTTMQSPVNTFLSNRCITEFPNVIIMSMINRNGIRHYRTYCIKCDMILESYYVRKHFKTKKHNLDDETISNILSAIGLKDTNHNTTKSSQLDKVIPKRVTNSIYDAISDTDSDHQPELIEDCLETSHVILTEEDLLKDNSTIDNDPNYIADKTLSYEIHKCPECEYTTRRTQKLYRHKKQYHECKIVEVPYIYHCLACNEPVKHEDAKKNHLNSKKHKNSVADYLKKNPDFHVLDIIIIKHSKQKTIGNGLINFKVTKKVDIEFDYSVLEKVEIEKISQNKQFMKLIEKYKDDYNAIWSIIDGLTKFFYNRKLKEKDHGYVYCLYNEIFLFYSETYHKLGNTNNPEHRLTNYSTPYPKKSEYKALSIQLINKEFAEIMLFHLLDEYRVYPNREFFDCSVDKVKDAIKLVEDAFKKEEAIIVPKLVNMIKKELISTIKKILRRIK